MSGPLQLIVMGVSGCGKSTVSNALAKALNLEMTDGDDLHLPASVAKMRNGIALDDADRWPWLDRIGQHLGQSGGDTSGGRVVACSALKRAYRDRIRRLAPSVRFVFLDGTKDVIRARLEQRKGHYMPSGLIDSQFSTLERPSADERDVITVTVEWPVEGVVQRALAALK